MQLEVQESKKAAELFQSTEMLGVKLQYSNRELKKATNDSTYLPSQLVYKTEDGISDSLKVQLRRRGNNRLENCYFAPVKIKIKKDNAKKTLFKGNKNLKLVLPCLLQRDNNDNVIKEYIAYKLYEFVSPVHFKTRMVDLTYEEIKGKKKGRNIFCAEKNMPPSHCAGGFCGEYIRNIFFFYAGVDAPLK